MNRERFSRNVFPVSLLCENRECMVVGGGKIATHKTRLLLEAGASVTIVSPEVKAEMNELIESGQVKHIARCFEPSDADGKFVTFAATNCKPVNRQVLEACHERNGLCCCVDGDWVNSDFVTPATLRKDDFILSISTGGGSCRRSRRLKENLRHHIEFLSNADLIIIGIDHNTGSYDQLEMSKARIASHIEMFSCLWGVHEFMVLSTCNRLEFIGVVADHAKTIQVLQHMLGLDGIGYVKRGRDAFVHLSEVASGLHAQTLGEKNIVAQLKLNLNEALSNGWAGGGIQAWLDQALHISKHIRQEIEPFIESMEIEDVCALWIGEHYPDAKNVLIVGRGVIGSGVLARIPNAKMVSGRDISEVEALLPDSDVVIGTTGSETYILTEKQREFLKDGAVLIDLSMPRNIDPDLPNVVGLADLKQWCRPDNLAHVMAISKPIIENHMNEYDRLVNI